MLQRHTSLSQNIIHFCRYLRGKGFTLGVDEEITALKALECIDYSSRQVLKLALKAICCKSQKQLHEFDALFNDYWQELGKAVDAKVKTGPEKKIQTNGKDASFTSLKSWLNGHRNQETEEMAVYSVQESLTKKDFSAVPDDEVDELMRNIKALSKRLAAHINRRYQRDNHANIPDLRRTLRKNMRRGGELLDIVFHQPKRNRTKLVILCDVSKSMDLYAAFLLQFMYAFQQVYKRVETFAFSTGLQRITTLLKQRDFATAMQWVQGQNQGWGGGTKIGESLHRFTEDYAGQLLDKRTIVIIMSDGWDTGDIPVLQHSMETIRNKCRKIIWLNPLAGYHAYSPGVAGMKAALPYVHVFAPAHNAESLRRLGQWL
ncbi:vWA domain-containing protein [Foetidibacter luteolus]|uniref:vWA domain-containing protein n=1 Tax=Foetidibacter luteolus TaxID=2608880 RepID=UPI00129C0626|nr:VWA domain-containing protein [Foetidibacter luteolus]